MMLSSVSSQPAVPRGVSPDERAHSSSRQDHQPRRPSKTIPIVGASMHRSPSELALLESERIAEERDYCMYTRIVNGMSASSRGGSFQDSWQSNDSLANIIRTRHTPIAAVDAHFEQLQERYQFEPDDVDTRKDSYNGSSNIPSHHFVVDCRAAQDSIGIEEGVFDMEL